MTKITKLLTVFFVFVAFFANIVWADKAADEAVAAKADTVKAVDTVDFSHQDLKNNTHKLSDYRGKWVLVNYWATWCPPCLEELPDLEIFHNKHKDKDAVVLGLNMEDIEKEKLKSFVDEQFLSYPILVVGAMPTDSMSNVPGLPTSYLINPAGEIAARQVGPVTVDAIENFIENYGKK